MCAVRRYGRRLYFIKNELCQFVFVVVETVFDRSNTSLKSFIFDCSQRLYFHFTLKRTWCLLTSYVFVVIKIVLDMLDGPNKDGQRFRYSQEVRLRTVVSFKIKTKLVFVVAKLRWLGRTKTGSLFM